MTFKRTDIHRPSAILPENYEFVCVNARDEMGVMIAETSLFNAHREHTGGKFSNHEHRGDCDVCGAYMIDYAIFYHEPTNSYIRTGCDCAAKIEAGHADEFRRVAELRRAKKKREAKAKAVAERLEALGVLDYVEGLFHEGKIGGPVVDCNVASVYDHDEEANFKDRKREDMRRFVGDVVDDLADFDLRRADKDVWTIVDIVCNMVKYGNPSTKAEKFLVNLVERMRNIKEIAFERKAEYDAAADAPEGKVMVRGKVLAIKTTDGYYGIVIKMLVVDDSGYKVWSTVPSKIVDEVEKGDRIEFNANLTPSDRDPKFAFAKRPSKAKVLEKTDKGDDENDEAE